MNKSIKRKFKNWLLYNPPNALSSKGWRLFDQEFKEKAPIRYYFSNNVKENFIWPIKWQVNKISDWIRYRLYDKYHKLNTGLTPGYYQCAEQILHVNFNILKNFVEVEQAWSSYIWKQDSYHKNWKERYIPFYFKFNFRSADIGVKHLKWASTLDDPALPPDEQSIHQAISAREIYELYNWWVNDRPNRVEIHSVEYHDQNLGIMACFDDDFDKDAPDYQAHIISYNLYESQVEQWEVEDDLMLNRLIKIRRDLWT